MPDYFTLAELRALPQMADSTKYPDARCEAAAAYIVGIIERETGMAFVARTVTETLDGTGSTYLQLGRDDIIDVTSAAVDGDTVTDDLSVRGGLLRRYTAGSSSLIDWPAGFNNVEVTYLAGYSAIPPADIKEAALKGTRAYLLATASNSAMDDRRTSMSTEQGTISYTVAGENRPTGYPEVDAVILAWSRRPAIGS